jgi:AraC-like DNA-binding protein
VFAYDLDLPAGHRCTPHSHEATELVFSLGCSGTLHQAAAAVEYGDRTVFVYQPGQPHWIENKTPGRQMCIGVVGVAVEETPAGVYEASEELTAIFAQIRESVSRRRHGDETRLDLLSGLAAIELAESIQEPREERSKAERVRDIIDTQFAMEWDVAALAHEVYVSPDYLRQLFRAEYGEPVIHYLINRRIEYAKALLRETDDAVAQIAEASGFHDPYYFSRVFKKHTGHAPSEYRAE